MAINDYPDQVESGSPRIAITHIASGVSPDEPPGHLEALRNRAEDVVGHAYSLENRAHNLVERLLGPQISQNEANKDSVEKVSESAIAGLGNVLNRLRQTLNAIDDKIEKLEAL